MGEEKIEFVQIFFEFVVCRLGIVRCLGGDLYLLCIFLKSNSLSSFSHEQFGFRFTLS